MLRAWAASALIACACACAEPKPKEVLLGGGAYAATLPPGWSVEEKVLKSGSRQATLTGSFEDEGTCVLSFIPAPSFPAETVRGNYAATQKKAFGSGASSPRTLSTGLGDFAGERYGGRAPDKGLAGKLAQFAGEMTNDVYAGKEGPTVIIVQVSTFAVSDHPERFRERCEGIARSLRLAPADAGRR